jgi:hypothetical protein
MPPITMYVSKKVIFMIHANCVVVSWHSKGHNATTIYEKLLARFHEEAPADSSVTDWFRRLGFGENILEPGSHPGKPSDGLIDVEILIELTAFPFHSVRTLARTLKIPRSTVWDHLQKERSVVKHLR